MKKKYISKEKIYDVLFREEKKNGLNKLGIMSSFSWDNDPKHLGFVLSRYKFVSKMLSGKKEVLEVGACDGWHSRIVSDAVQNLTISDFDKNFINFGKRTLKKFIPKAFLVHDMTIKSTKNKYDAIYALDVFEHISKKKEKKFIKNIVLSLSKNGVLIIGCPSLEAQKFSSNDNNKGHVNCKTGDELKATFERYFFNVFLFSMNDEVVHTGFYKMAHYLFVICTNPKKK